MITASQILTGGVIIIILILFVVWPIGVAFGWIPKWWGPWK